MAERLAVALCAQQQGLSPAPERETVASYLARWLDDVARPNVTPRTCESYEMIVRRHLVPALGRIKFAKLDPQDVQAYMAAERANGLSPRTVGYHRAVLRKGLHKAMRWGLVARNAAALAKPPKQERREWRNLTPDEARHLLAAIKGHPLEPLVITALGLGLRQAEVFGLAWCDIDEADGLVRPGCRCSGSRGRGWCCDRSRARRVTNRCSRPTS